MYINYLQKLARNGSEDSRKMLTVRKNYSGATYKDYLKGNAKFSGYDAITKGIKMHFNVRVNIDRAIQEVLQDDSFAI
jgi:acyl carrier protein phosphodiesterase